ncbi:hypothetical protein LEN26_002483 [Aphanomyces euteiches]|nr:hypothetical protein LEN26_002483 [Aphanomyces euteiches]
MTTPSPATPHKRLDASVTPTVRRSPRLVQLINRIEDDTIPEESTQPEIRSHPTLIKLQIDLRFKETVNQRVNTAKILGKHTIQADSWGEIKNSIWQLCHHHLQPLATYAGEPTTWSQAESTPTIDLFHKYVSMRLQSARQINPWESSNDRKYVIKHQDEIYMVTALKYGNAISKTPELEEFQAQCLEPSVLDRAGAAAEALVQALIAVLKEEWGRHLVAQEIYWRLWASWLIQQKKNDASRYIKEGPPHQLVKGFQPTSSTAQVHLLRVQRGVKMTLKVIDAVESQVESLQQKYAVIEAEIAGLCDILDKHRAIVQAMGEDVTIDPDDTRVVIALSAIPNQEDIDHAC